MGLILAVLEVTIVVAIAYYVYKFFYPTAEKVPQVKDGWYGKRVLKEGEAIPEDDITINKFMVHISDDVLDDLKRRLELSRFVEPIDGTEFNYGFNSEYLKEVVEYWKTQFDWRQRENELNKYENYLTQIEGIDIHFIHVKPVKPSKTVIPLMVIHGWPGSVYEYYKSFPLLTEPVNDIAFEVICPSIPGYGFSEAPHQQSFNAISTARIFVKLMDRLGHKRFFVHGGDWGSFVSKTLAIIHPQNIRGVHTTLNNASITNVKGVALIKYIVAMFVPSLVFDEPEKDYKKIFPFFEKFFFFLREMGYMHIQATKPDTVGAALNDSPVGLAAYILEKFSTWTNPDNVRKSDGGLTEKFTLDELLTNVMIYWVSNNVTSSMRYYKENMVRMREEAKVNLYRIPITVPAAVADFPHEIARMPKLFAQYAYLDLVQYTEMPRGGHFAAFEEPKLVSDDIRKFVVAVLDRDK